MRKVMGNNVRGYRRKQNFTLEKLAILSGLHINYISSLERGERNVGILNVAKLGKALKIPPNLLLVPDSYKVE
jgi:transcriptional regulator with XRE-family HTH domain